MYIDINNAIAPTVQADGGVILKHGVPGQVVFVEQLARTDVGKVDKNVLRKSYGR